jgi:UDP-glucose 4-epimerase
MKKILITGSSGYIGRHLTSLLYAYGEYETTGLDRVYRTQPVNSQFIEQNILENMDIPGEYDTVVHLAGLVNVGMSMQAPMDYYRTNVVGTLNMLERAQYDHFIFASTGAATNPYSPYGMSKLVTEGLVRQYCTLNNKKCTIFRFYNVIGTAGYPPTNIDGLMYNLIKAKDTGVFHIYGNDYNIYDGTAIRDYLHVMEVCQAIKNAVDKPLSDSLTLIENLGHGKGHSVLEMVNVFKKVNNCDFGIKFMPRREGDVARTILDDVSAYMPTQYVPIEEMLKV